MTLTDDQVGRLLFGSGVRFKVAAWLVQRIDPVFYPDEFNADTGSYSTSIGSVCSRLAQLGMVEKIGDPPHSRCKYYRRTDSPLWDVVQKAVDVLERRPPAREGVTEVALSNVHERLRGMEMDLRQAAK